MKGFVDEVNEQITDLNNQIVEKDIIINELREKLSKTDDENQEIRKHLNATALAVAEMYESTLDKGV